MCKEKNGRILVIMFIFDMLDIKYYLKQISTIRLNLIDKTMQNKLTKNLFEFIHLAMATIYMLY